MTTDASPSGSSPPRANLVATWTFSLKEGAAVQPFDTLGPTIRRKVEERLEAIAGFLSG